MHVMLWSYVPVKRANTYIYYKQMRTASLTLVLKDTIRDGGSEALYSTLFTINYTKKKPMPMHNVDFVQYDAPVSFMTLYPIQ